MDANAAGCTLSYKFAGKKSACADPITSKLAFMGDLKTEMLMLAQNARSAARILATASTDQKNSVLTYAIEGLARERFAIESANSKDLAAGKDKGLSGPMLDR